MKKYSKIIMAWLLIFSMIFSNSIFASASGIWDYINKTLILNTDSEDTGGEIITISDDVVLSEDGDILPDENTPGWGILRVREDTPRATDSDVELEIATSSIAIFGDTLAVDIRLVNLVGDTTNDDDTFWVTENIPAVADVSISGNGASIPSPWVVLTVPKLATINKPTFIDSQNAYSTLKLEDNDNYYVIYKYYELTGGTRATFPYPFSFKENPTVNGDSIDIKLAIVDASGVTNPENTNGTWNINTVKDLMQNRVLYQTDKTYIAKSKR